MKSKHAPWVNSRGNFAFARSLPSLHPRALALLEPAIQRKTNSWQRLTEMFTSARNIFTQCWSTDTLFAQLSINPNTDFQYQICTYGNGATLLLVLAHARTVTSQLK